MKDKIKEYWWVALLLMICLINIGFSKNNQPIILKEDVFYIELGNKPSENINDYILIMNDDLSFRNSVLNESMLDLSVDYNVTGDYECTYNYMDITLPFNITVQDTIAPLFGNSKDYILIKNSTLIMDDFIDNLKIYDVQDFNVHIDNIDYLLNDIGRHKVEVTATDLSNNSTTSNVYIQVVEEKESIEYSEVTYVGNKENLNELVIEKEESINTSWWMNLSDSELINKVTSSLVWKNELTNEMYYGIENLLFGFNVDDWAYGGLKLIKNPYNLQFSGYQFSGGVEFISSKSFNLYWSSNDALNRYVDCGKLKINVPNKTTATKVYEFYDYVREV